MSVGMHVTWRCLSVSLMDDVRPRPWSADTTAQLDGNGNITVESNNYGRQKSYSKRSRKVLQIYNRNMDREIQNCVIVIKAATMMLAGEWKSNILESRRWIAIFFGLGRDSAMPAWQFVHSCKEHSERPVCTLIARIVLLQHIDAGSRFIVSVWGVQLMYCPYLQDNVASAQNTIL
jgi:hypothetical protein